MLDHAVVIRNAELTQEEVRARFEWAVRQGNPHWLWPDISPDDWADALSRIARLTRSVLTQGRSSEPMEGDAAIVGVAAFTSGMGPLLGYWLREARIETTTDIGSLLDLHLQHNEARMQLMAERAGMVLSALAANGVRPTVLKGMHTAFNYFPGPGTRPLADIDILVSPSDEKVACRTMRDMGFEGGIITAATPRQCDWRLPSAEAQPRTLQFLHTHDPWSIDLQMSLNRRYAFGAPVIELDRLTSHRATLPSTLWPQVDVLSEPLLALHLACHASAGLTNLTLIRLVEFAFVVRQDQEAGTFRWDEFASAAHEAGALGIIYPTLKLCEDLAPRTIPEGVLAASLAATPPRVRNVVDSLTPEGAHLVVRCSLEEKFMWTPPGPRTWLQVFQTMLPPRLSLRDLLNVYRMRIWRLVNGTVASGWHAPRSI